MGYLQTSPVTRMEVIVQNTIVFVRVSPFHRVIIIGSRPNCSDATDIFVRRPIFGMSHGLTNTTIARPSSIVNAEGRHRRMWWIETQPVQNVSLALTAELCWFFFHYVT